MKNRNDFDQKGLHEMLQNYSSDYILHYIHQREDVYIEGWYNAYHINNNTELPMNLCPAFIKYANKKGIAEKLEEAVEQWLESIKEELNWYLANEVFSDIKNSGYLRENREAYNHFLFDRISVEYDADLGIYAEIDLSYKEGDMQLRTEQPFTKEDAEMIVFDLMNVYKPHQGNLKTHLEEKMQELINDYLF